MSRNQSDYVGKRSSFKLAGDWAAVSFQLSWAQNLGKLLLQSELIKSVNDSMQTDQFSLGVELQYL